MKITEEIFMVGGSNSHSSDAAVYLINAGEKSVLIDTGTGQGERRILSNIKSYGVTTGSIEYIFLTHCHFDHTGGAPGLKEATGALLVAHELDSIYLENGDSRTTAASWYGRTMPKIPVDIKISEKQRVFRICGRDLTVYHTPGHSPGSTVLTFESEGKLVLFGQDIHGPLDSSLKSCRDDYVHSLKFISRINPDILCEGHYGVIHGTDKIQTFIKSYM